MTSRTQLDVIDYFNLNIVLEDGLGSRGGRDAGHVEDGVGELRPANTVMIHPNIDAVYPNALSFARSLAAKLVAEKWQTEKLRTKLDDEGRGEALFRLTGPDRTFHFMAISNVFPQGQKVDRSFGVNWDISAAICEGEWTAEREDDLRVNIPLQRAGRFDNDTLAFARGNRSERIFDQVVDALALGRQPDPKHLASVGYIFRTTGFHSNGAVGMRPYDGIAKDHPLRHSYHAQMCLALLMREFVFDLVDHLAQARGGVSAARLDVELKRYLGIGNSAGLGLVPFLSNHPRIVHHWKQVNEAALAEAKGRSVMPGCRSLTTFAMLLDKAARYFAEDPRDGNAIFTSYERITIELEKVKRLLAQKLSSLADETHGFWAALAEDVRRDCHPETLEVFHSLLLEVHPDIVLAYAEKFDAEEAFVLQPEMTLAELHGLLVKSYGWLFASELSVETASAYFWYSPEEAPNEPRRGRRGILSHLEFETKMDAPLRAVQLKIALQDAAAEKTVADFLLAQRHHRSFIHHIQSIADCDYALVRESTLTDNYRPFGAMRFTLAFYGMEKLDPRLPRSVKGAFFQGAPLMADIAEGRDGIWPFPLIPGSGAPKASGATDEVSTALPLPMRLMETPEAAAKSLTRLVDGRKHAKAQQRVSTNEIRRGMAKLLQFEGFGLGEAEQIAQIAIVIQALGIDMFSALFTELDNPRPLITRISEIGRVADHVHLDGLHGSVLANLCCGSDFAQAGVGGGSTSSALVSNTGTGDFLVPLPYLAAMRGFVSLLVWQNERGEQHFATAGPDGKDGPWLATGPLSGNGADIAGKLGLAWPVDGPFRDASFLHLCARPAMTASGDIFSRITETWPEGLKRYAPGETGRRLRDLVSQGMLVPSEVLERFLFLSRRTLISSEIEEKIK